MPEKVELGAIYIAGPMRGCPDLNFLAFDSAQKQWEAWGWRVYSPAAVDRCLSVSAAMVDAPKELRRVIQLDLLLICNADAIALLPGWRASSGATVELALAQFLKIKVFNAVTGKEMFVESVPWIHTLKELHDAPTLPQRHPSISGDGQRYPREIYSDPDHAVT